MIWALLTVILVICCIGPGCGLLAGRAIARRHGWQATAWGLASFATTLGAMYLIFVLGYAIRGDEQVQEVSYKPAYCKNI